MTSQWHNLELFCDSCRSSCTATEDFIQYWFLIVLLMMSKLTFISKMCLWHCEHRLQISVVNNCFKHNNMIFNHHHQYQWTPEEIKPLQLSVQPHTVHHYSKTKAHKRAIPLHCVTCSFSAINISRTADVTERALQSWLHVYATLLVWRAVGNKLQWM